MKINKPRHVLQLAFDHDWPTSVAFLNSGQQLAAGNRHGEILIWDISQLPASTPQKPVDLPPTRLCTGHKNAITKLVSANNGKTFISASLDRSIFFWNASDTKTDNGEIILDFKKRQRKARRKRDAEKEKILAAPGVKVPTIKPFKRLDYHKNWIQALAISSDGKRLISGDDDCLTVVYDLSTNREVSRWTGYQRVWITAAALSPGGRTAFTAEYAGSRSSFDRPAAQVRLWNADNGKLQRDLLKQWTPKIKDKDRKDSYGYARAWGKLLKRGLVAAEFSQDGKRLAVAQGGETSTGKVHLIDTETGKIARTVSGHRSGACDVKFSKDGQFILSSGRDTTVRICSSTSGKEVAQLGRGRGGQFKDWLHAIDISPDQQLVAAADIAGMVHVWRLA